MKLKPRIKECPFCGGEMEIKKVAQNGGMDGTYYNWELTCKKCGLAMACAADGFYGRKYKTYEEVVSDWNRNKKKEKIIKADVLDKIRTEIEQLRMHKAQFLTNDNKVCIDSQEVLDILDKYKTESEEV